MAAAATGTPQKQPPPPPRSSRLVSIQRVAVLGAGTMGARIAAHVANAGIPVLLLDMVPASGSPDTLATQALVNLKSAKPAAFASPSAAALISIGNFDDDLPRLRQCDWIIEAVAENLEIKRSLLARVAPHLHATAIFTTNTSGLPVASIAAQLPDALRRRWFGTHFFNPPRYMRLLEIIPIPASDPVAVASIADFCDRHLGKTVVPANDVQNFIANRVGTFAMLNTVRIMQQQNLSIQQIDLLTGQAIGWPKTGTFRLADMVGLDVLASVARNFTTAEPDERPDVVLPPLIDRLIERKWLGDKTRQGFYKKERGGPDAKDALSVIDPASLEYVPTVKVSLPALDQAKSIDSVEARLKFLLSGNPATDPAARFYWTILPELWSYAANRIGEVTESLVDIDRAMTSGFNWELGPFALWDAAGVPAVVEKMRAASLPIPAAVEKLLATGGTSWYRAAGTEFFDPASSSYRPTPSNPELAPIAARKRSSAASSNGVFSGNSAISLVDLGNGVGCFELHSKMNAIGSDIVGFLRRELKPGSKATGNFDAFILSTDAQNFSVGANLMQLLLAIQDEEWDEIATSVRQFQAMTQAIKFCPRPVVVAAAGLCLGGGCEMSLHAALRQPHLELYTGLVETGVGLIPGGGGCKELVLRATADAARIRFETQSAPRSESAPLIDIMRSVFETIAMAKVSTSAAEARDLRLVADVDTISMNRGRLVHDAAAQALRLAAAGYTPPAPRTDIPAPGASVFATLRLGIYLLREGQYITDHDNTVATHVARILTGGDITPGTPLSEQHLLDLEREAFLSLCGEPKTLERIRFTLKTGKPLRN